MSDRRIIASEFSSNLSPEPSLSTPVVQTIAAFVTGIGRRRLVSIQNSVAFLPQSLYASSFEIFLARTARRLDSVRRVRIASPHSRLNAIAPLWLLMLPSFGTDRSRLPRRTICSLQCSAVFFSSAKSIRLHVTKGAHGFLSVHQSFYPGRLLRISL